MQYTHTFLLKCFLIGLLGSFLTVNSFAQDDLLDMLEEEGEETTDYTFATFKTSKIINGHSIETNSTGVMQFVVGHRFGRINAGPRELFGIDNATIRLALEYGLTDQLDIGLGRSSFEKTYDGFIKYKFLRQSKGKRKMPLTATAIATTAIKTNKWPEPGRENLFSSRMYYSYSLLVARKFNKIFSMQLSPMMVHRNLVRAEADRNDVFILGVGGRVKLTGSLAITGEYHYVFPNQIASLHYGEEVSNAASIGIDLETGGHVFQLHFTNSRGMIDKIYASETTGKWLDGDIHFGFNVTRVFGFKKEEEGRVA